MGQDEHTTNSNNSTWNTSVPYWKRSVLSYRRLFQSSSFRVFVLLLTGFICTPLGLLIACGIALCLVLTSLCLPFLIGPLCFSFYVTLLVYTAWRLVRLTTKFMKHVLNTLKKGFGQDGKQLSLKVIQVFPYFVQSFLLIYINQSPNEEADIELEKNVDQASVDESSSSEDCEEVIQENLRRLNVRSLLHITRPRFYSVEESQEINSEKPSSSSARKNGDRQEKNTTLYQNTESSILLKNVAIVKSYPNDGPTMLEKLEDMRRILTNIRRRDSNRRSSHAHKESR